MSLTAAWKEEGPGGKAPLPLTPAVVAATAEQQQRLAMGRNLVPGVCFVHRTRGFRGAILGYDPACHSPKLKAQPCYHCITDERDQGGGRLTIVAEEDIEVSLTAFPLQGELVDLLLVPSPALGGYVPGPKIEAALREQLVNGGMFDM